MKISSSALVLLVGLIHSPVLRAQNAALDRAPSRFARYEGSRVHYKSLGTGATAVVFIHGWNCDLSVWRAQVPVGDGRTRAIVIDLPGFGQSDKPETSYSMDYFAGAVQAVLTAAGVTRAVLVGHSMGTPVVRQFYRRHRAEVIGLVLVDGALRPFFKDTAEARPFLERFNESAYAVTVSTMFDGMIATMDSADRVAIRRSAMATPQRVGASAMRGMLDPAIWGDDPIEVPVLAVMAPNPGWSADYVAYVRRLVPNLRYETMEGAGHFLMVERAAAFNAMLKEFLGTIIASTGG